MKRVVLVRGFGSPDAHLIVQSLRGVVEAVSVLVRLPEHGDGALPEANLLAEIGPVLECPSIAHIVPRVLDFARHERIDGVVTFSELTIVQSAQIADALRLPHHSLAAVRKTVDKHRQRAALQAAGVAVPRFARVDSRAPRRALQAVGLPAVLKPLRGTGSTATTLITDAEMLCQELEALMPLHRRTLLWPGDEPAFVLEECLQGVTSNADDLRLAPYVSVETLVYQGKFWHLGVTDKLPQVPNFRETGHLAPSCRPQALRHMVIAEAEEAIRALGLTDGVVQTEVILTAQGARVVEVNPRPGGTVPYNYIAATGVDVVREAVRVALGETPQVRALKPLAQAVTWCPQSPPRDVALRALEGVDEIRSMPGVRKVWAAEPPVQMRWQVAGPGGGTLMRATAVLPDRESVWRWINDCERILRPHYEYAELPR